MTFRYTMTVLIGCGEICNYSIKVRKKYRRRKNQKQGKKKDK